MEGMFCNHVFFSTSPYSHCLTYQHLNLLLEISTELCPLAGHFGSRYREVCKLLHARWPWKWSCNPDMPYPWDGHPFQRAQLHPAVHLWRAADLRQNVFRDVKKPETYTQGCHWTFAKITENLCVRAVSQKMNTKRDAKFRKRKMN